MANTTASPRPVAVPVATSKRRRSVLQLVGEGLTWLAIAVVVIWTIFPFYWAIVNSIKPPRETLNGSIIPFVQFTPTLQNWRDEIVGRGPELGQGLLNSVIVASVSTLLCLVLGSLAGYGLARFQYRGWKNQNIAGFFLGQRFLPPVVTVIPFFLMMRSIGLSDNKLALILAYTVFNLPFAVLILQDAFAELPLEIEEAALVDGASHLGVLWRVALPLVAPVVVAAGFICFAFAWNEFLFALVLTYQDSRTIPVLVAGSNSVQGTQFWYVATRMLVAIIPPVVLALLAQRYIVRGLTYGAVKG